MSLLNHSSAVGRRLQRLVGRRYAPGDKPLSSAAVGRRVAPANVEFRPPSPLLAKVAPGTEG